ncbi:MAG: 3-hydroxybutyryl-CoA dehydrogenase [Gammaproteobacteria bacterium]|nr:3-hydroxybutyryl-CoA dehydrogenase [Gammaproteobacteria bacterium]
MSIDRVGIVGGGTMGRGIAQVCAASGLDVTLCDVAQDPLEQALGSIEKGYARLVQKAQMSETEMRSAQQRLRTSTDLAVLSEVDMVIEAATENPRTKLELFTRLGELCAERTILASNTSSISLTRIAAAAAHPQRVIGMHFFNPVPVMKLIEVIRALQTSDSTFEQVRALAERLGKVSVAVNDSPGFVVNRMLVPMINEAVLVLAEGAASAEEIDVAMRLGANHPMGPLALADLIGLDVCLYVMEVLHEQFADSKYRPAPLLRKMVDAGYLGRKSGRGFFEYG